MGSQFINDRLNAQHEQFITKMKPEFQVVFTGPIIEQGVEERHGGRLEAYIVTINAYTSIQVVDYRL